MLLDLLRRPQSTIAGLSRSDGESWVVPMAGFFFISFTAGYENIVTIWPEWPGIVLVLLTAAGAIVLGSWAWAGLFGGVLHLSARVFRGRAGVAKTIRAVGYGLFWPGLVAAVASAAVVLVGYRGRVLPSAAVLPLLIAIAAGVWGVYTITASLRARHEFAWWRAICAYLLPFLLLFTAVAGAILVGS